MHQSCPSGMKLNIIVDHNSHLHLCIKKEKKKPIALKIKSPIQGNFYLSQRKAQRPPKSLKWLILFKNYCIHTTVSKGEGLRGPRAEIAFESVAYNFLYYQSFSCTMQFDSGTTVYE